MSWSINMLIQQFWKREVKHYLESRAKVESFNSALVNCIISTFLTAFNSLKDALQRADLYFRELYEIFGYHSSSTLVTECHN